MIAGIVGFPGSEISIGADLLDLPIPKLKTLAPKVTIKHAHSDEDLPAAVVTRDQITPISTEPVRAQSASALFTAQDDDPWGAADVQERARPHAVPVMEASVQRQPDIQVQSPPRVADSIMSDQMDGSITHEPDDIHAGLRNTGLQRQQSDNWGNSIYDPPTSTGFGGETGYASGGISDWPGMGARHGSFGGLGGNPLAPPESAPSVQNGNGASTGLSRIRNLLKSPEETVTITVLPEKEGMFLFQHRNYQVYSSRRNARVVRRYSDFVWLLECLHKRYPFRTIPLLPPKRLAGEHLRLLSPIPSLTTTIS